MNVPRSTTISCNTAVTTFYRIINFSCLLYVFNATCTNYENMKHLNRTEIESSDATAMWHSLSGYVRAKQKGCHGRWRPKTQSSAKMNYTWNRIKYGNEDDSGVQNTSAKKCRGRGKKMLRKNGPETRKI